MSIKTTNRISELEKRVNFLETLILSLQEEKQAASKTEKAPRGNTRKSAA
jgi:hypothetical protein